MKIRIPVIVLIPILIGLVVICTQCAKKDDEVRQESGEKIVTVSRGEWNGTQYNNEFIKVTFNLPTNWNKYSDEQLAKLMNIDETMLQGEAKEISELAEKQPVHIMVANDPTTRAKVMIMIEKVNSEITAENYVNTLKQQLESGVNNELGRAYTEMISGEEYKVLEVSMLDYSMEQIYYIRKQENYIVNIIITTAQTGQQKQILKYFE